MKTRVFLGSLLAGAISMSALTAGEPPRQSRSDDQTSTNQVRAEKVEQPVASLLERCQKMLDVQITVSDATAGLHKVIQGTAEKKPRPKDKKVALTLFDKQKDLIAEATKIIAMLKAEESAIAIVEVFEMLRDDMKRVQSRLKVGDVGTDTQATEREIIDQLKEMIKSLKKG
jgi:hypothetical protein